MMLKNFRKPLSTLAKQMTKIRALSVLMLFVGLASGAIAGNTPNHPALNGDGASTTLTQQPSSQGNPEAKASEEELGLDDEELVPVCGNSGQPCVNDSWCCSNHCKTYMRHNEAGDIEYYNACSDYPKPRR